MNAPSVSALGTTPQDPREAAMRKAAADLQGLFVQQMYKAMRESVSTDDGLVERSQGEEMFAGLMDERFAADTGTRWHRGLGDAIYRAIRQKAGLEEAAASIPSVHRTAEPPAAGSASSPVPPVHALVPPDRTR
jgi:peptidoglycan hydrolase FlgJ